MKWCFLCGPAQLSTTRRRKERENSVVLPCGGGLEYYHHSPAGRKKHQNSLKWKSKVRLGILMDLNLGMAALTTPSRNCTDKLQTYPLVREGAPQEETANVWKYFPFTWKKNSSRVPDYGLISGQTGRLTAVRKGTWKVSCKSWVGSQH